MLDCEAGQLVGFLQCDLLAGGGTGTGIGHVRQRDAPIREPRHDGRHFAGMQRPQPGVDRSQCLPPLGGQAVTLHLPLGGMDRGDGLACEANGIASMLAGLSE